MYAWRWSDCDDAYDDDYDEYDGLDDWLPPTLAQPLPTLVSLAAAPPCPKWGAPKKSVGRDTWCPIGPSRALSPGPAAIGCPALLPSLIHD